ncbi:hypothetical protein ES703_99946 [subsurface metagenome]
MDSGTNDYLQGIWGSSNSSVFAVGGYAIVHYNGANWTSMSSNTTSPLYSVWGSSDNSVFAVGGGGTIVHYNGANWTSMSSGTGNDLSDIWGSSPTDVYAVGGYGTILHYNGSTWGTMSGVTGNALQAVWGSSSTDVFAVGAAGTIVHNNGINWSVMSSPTTNDLYGVWGSSSTDVLAVGTYGTVLHYATEPDITVSPLVLNFGSVVVGSSSSAVPTVVVSNDGTANLTIGTANITGPDAALFSIISDNASSRSLAPGASAPIRLLFSATSPGSKSATLSIPSDDPDEPRVSVALRGNGAAPDLIIIPKFEKWVEEGAGTYTVHYFIKNQGDTEVPAGHDVGLTVDNVTLEQKVVPVALAAGAMYGGSFDTVVTLSGGADNITVCADLNSEVDELDETNNCLSSTWPPSGLLISINAPDRVTESVNFTATIDIGQVASFDAGNYDVSFDSTVLTLNSVTSGNITGANISGTVIPVDIYNRTGPGTVSIVQNVPGLTGVNGTGYLAVLHFHVIGSLGDSSGIGLSNGTLSDNMSVEIPVTWIGDFVKLALVPGDANGDGNINALDITKVERIIAGLDATTFGADANKDGDINAIDITKVERIIVGLD